jgi:hypothetical protein
MNHKTTSKPKRQGPQSVGNGPRLTRSLDLLYLDKPVRAAFVDGTTIEGVVTRFTMYWLEIKLNNGKVVYVNKGSIKLIEPLEEEKGGSSMGGVENGRNKPKWS